MSALTIVSHLLAISTLSMQTILLMMYCLLSWVLPDISQLLFQHPLKRRYQNLTGIDTDGRARSFPSFLFLTLFPMWIFTVGYFNYLNWLNFCFFPSVSSEYWMCTYSFYLLRRTIKNVFSNILTLSLPSSVHVTCLSLCWMIAQKYTL